MTTLPLAALTGIITTPREQQWVVFQNELKRGSPELTAIFARPIMRANDTSAAVGYAPYTETESIVLAAEKHINSTEFKERFPEAIEWPTIGLPDDYHALLAPARSAFVRETERLVGHGGASLEELIVPLVQIERRDT